MLGYLFNCDQQERMKRSLWVGYAVFKLQNQILPVVDWCYYFACTSNIINCVCCRVATGNPVVFTLSPPECYMEIRYGYGTSGNRVGGPVRVGDPLTLIIYMRSKYGTVLLRWKVWVYQLASENRSFYMGYCWIIRF